jgi:hypothetical protein
MTYQQSLNIHQALPEQDKSNAGWQRDLIVSLYKLGTTTANIGGNDNVTQAQEFLRFLHTWGCAGTSVERCRLFLCTHQ